MNKKNIIIFSIIILFSIQIIISYGLIFYNKKNKINFNINTYEEKFFTINNNSKLTYYEKDIINNDNIEKKTIVVLHAIFKSSFNSDLILSNYFNIYNDFINNFKIILIDLPAHGKSFKENNYDYSFRNTSSTLLKLLESININNIYLLCDGISSNIGLNMISLNDKIFSSIVLINPIFNLNTPIKNTVLQLKNKFMTLKNFAVFNHTKSKDSFKNYTMCYFNEKNSSNQYIKKMIQNSSIVTLKNFSTNINIYVLVTNKFYFTTSYLKNLSNNSSATFFLPNKDVLKEIIKK